MITIDRESKQRSRLAIDINFAGNRYKTENELFTFPTPSLDMYDKHLYYLIKNSDEKEFERKYVMRPDYMSFDEYGTVSLAQMLMYVNIVPSVEEFNLQTVIVPTMSAVIEMLRDKYPIQDPDSLNEVNW